MYPTAYVPRELSDIVFLCGIGRVAIISNMLPRVTGHEYHEDSGIDKSIQKCKKEL
jgi:hypothetical protein